MNEVDREFHRRPGRTIWEGMICSSAFWHVWELDAPAVTNSQSPLFLEELIYVKPRVWISRHIWESMETAGDAIRC